MKRTLASVALIVVLPLLVACAGERVVEVPVEVIREVPVEVVKTVEVVKEVPVEVEVVKEVEVEKVVEVEKLVEVPFPLPTEPLDVANALLAEMNAYNVGRALELFADNAVVTLVPTNLYTGKDEIRRWLQELVADNFHVDVVGELSVEGERVTGKTKISSDFLRGLGLDEVEATSVAVVRDGKVHSSTLTPNLEAAAILLEALPLSVVNRFVEAQNSGDIAALAEIYAKDVVIAIGPFGPDGRFETIEGIAAALSDDIDSLDEHVEVSFSDPVVEGDTVRGEFRLSSDEIREFARSMSGNFEAVVDGTKLSRLTITLDTETLALVQQAFAGAPAAQVVEAYFEAFNDGDIDTLADLYAEDVVFTFGPFGPEDETITQTGKERALDDDRDSIEHKARIDFVITGVEGNIVIGDFTFTDDEEAGLGGALGGRAEITVEDGKITSFSVVLDEETQALISALEELPEAFGFGAPTPENIVDITALIQAEGTPELQSKWAEIINTILAGAGPPPPELLDSIAATFKESGNAEADQKFKDFVQGATAGEGGKEFLQLAAVVSATEDPKLHRALGRIVEFALEGGEPPLGLFFELLPLLAAAGVEAIAKTFEGFFPPPGFGPREFGPPPPPQLVTEMFVELATLIEDSGDAQLRSKWVEVLDSALANAGPPPQFFLNQMREAIESSGNKQVGEKFGELLDARTEGHGGVRLLELAVLVQASEDLRLQELLGEIVVQAVIFGPGPSPELDEEFRDLVQASGNEALSEAVQLLEVLPPGEEFEDGDAPTPEEILGITEVIRTKGTEELQDVWIRLMDGVVGSIGPLPTDLLGRVLSAVQASGNTQVQQGLQQLIAAATTGKGGAELLEVLSLVQESGDSGLQEAVKELFEFLFEESEPPEDVLFEFLNLISAPENEDVEKAFRQFTGIPEDVEFELPTAVPIERPTAVLEGAHPAPERVVEPGEDIEGPPVEAVLELHALVEATGDSELDAAWVKIFDAVVSSVGFPPEELLFKVATSIVSSGNTKLLTEFEQFALSAERGEAGAGLLKLGVLAHASEDSTLKDAVGELMRFILSHGEPPEELLVEFMGLADALRSKDIAEAFQRIFGPGDEPTEASQGSADQVQRYLDEIAPIVQEADARNTAFNREVPGPGAESTVTDAKLWFDGIIRIQEEQLDGLRHVEAPAELKEVHNDYLEAQSAALELNRRVSKHLAGAGKDFVMARLAEDPELGIEAYARLVDRVAESCRALVTAGGVSVDLRCGSSR